MPKDIYDISRWDTTTELLGLSHTKVGRVRAASRQRYLSCLKFVDVLWCEYVDTAREGSHVTVGESLFHVSNSYNLPPLFYNLTFSGAAKCARSRLTLALC